ncbi:MAG: bifunctional glutamate N-acetyltransferase/amino-acid acetyltransferase ArgJ [Lachnospiraceae bacterium]|nr:bifunctional glutamate N-acetyltransferase/amino-acid acetyltransferase ArgJ [Lachnospiraceae bacterium]
MRFEEFEGYKYVDGGVCAAMGFTANGLNCGINPNPEKNDLGLVFSEAECNAAGVFTQNKVKGAPVIVTRENLKKSGGKARAVIANSKNANTCNANGIEIAEGMCDLVAKELNVKSEEVIVASTGVIGMPMSLKPVEDHIKPLAEGLTRDGNDRAMTAIMTTDTVEKQVAVEFTIDGKTCRIGGMGKGSGMIHPNMATTLNFITSDVAISSELLQKALSELVKVTFNCISVDGDQSTNDTCTVMANGLAGNDMIETEGEPYEIFKKGLYIVMLNIAKMLAADGEGATKLITCKVDGADSEETAVTVAKSVICSSLLKCAIFGGDANWGRILCAIGYADAEFDIDKVSVNMASKAGSIAVCRNGSGVAFSEEEAAEILKDDEITILVDLHQGESSATAFGCDLTYDYVKINGDYRS